MAHRLGIFGCLRRHGDELPQAHTVDAAPSQTPKRSDSSAAAKSSANPNEVTPPSHPAPSALPSSYGTPTAPRPSPAPPVIQSYHGSPAIPHVQSLPASDATGPARNRPIRVATREITFHDGRVRYLALYSDFPGSRPQSYAPLFRLKSAADTWARLRVFLPPEECPPLFTIVDEWLEDVPPDARQPDQVYALNHSNTPNKRQWAYIDSGLRVHICDSLPAIMRAKAASDAIGPDELQAAMAAQIRLPDGKSTLSLYRAPEDRLSNAPTDLALLQCHADRIPNRTITLGAGHLPIRLITRSPEGTNLRFRADRPDALAHKWATAAHGSLRMDTNPSHHWDGLGSSVAVRTDLQLEKPMNSLQDALVPFLKRWKTPLGFQPGRAYAMLRLEGLATLGQALEAASRMGIRTVVLDCCQGDNEGSQIYCSITDTIVDARTLEVVPYKGRPKAAESSV